MKKISYIELSSVLLCIIISFHSGITINILKNQTGIDSWISIILSYIIGIIPILLTLYISNYQEKLNIFEKNISLFGEILGKTLNILISIILFMIGITILYNIISFITTQYIYHTPMLLTSIVFILVIIYCSTKEINVICHISIILMTFNIILLLLTGISIMGEIKFDNLLPILKTDISNIIISSIKIACINTLPTIILLIIPKDKITNKNKYNKSILLAYFIGSLISLFIIISTIGVLSIYLTKVFEFSEYIVLKKIKLLGFLERTENIISMQWITESYIYLTLIIYTISKSITNNHKKFKYINIIVGLLLVITSNYLFKNTTIFNNFINTKFIYIISILFIIYIVITIKILIDKKLHFKYNK